MIRKEKKMNRNVINGFLIVLFLAATIISGLAWFNNVAIAREWYQDIQKGKIYKIVSTEAERKEAEKQKMEAKIYSGPIPQLAWWSKVDISTVTTFVPFLGFLLIAIGLIKIVIWGYAPPKIVSEYFPFFDDHDRKMVILGLAGTFWGLIMIGYYPGKPDMSHLMLCLHTALYSTLIAVLWVFFVTMPGQKVMAWWLEKCTGLKIGADTDITAVFEEFGAASVQAGNNLKQGSKEIKEFKEQMSKTKEGLREVLDVLKQFKEKTGIDVLDSFRATYQKVGSALEKISQGFDNQDKFQKQTLDHQQKMLKENQTVLNQYRAELLEQAKLRNDAEARERALTQQNAALVSKLDQLKAGFKDLAKNL